ncbi:ABC transporter ATP-binding protein [Lichenibacterium ramalinae]|uniref:ABC transporter ATP-binding protein n=1 Tax=Lichenibacterium ramalinae TaxID=2316527 RepID=A0A4V1RJ38_9HYPH|nr:ABC transporter ATP-binding protein [Lichenibacterium ramalinae]RYB06968.1 ABC transporter ATP-binding protein [Lichenibacterium ramalinae]
MAQNTTAAADEGGRTFPLVRRLMAEHARAHAGSYAAALVLMAVSAAASVGSVALLRPVVNGMTGMNVAEPGAFKTLRNLAVAVAILYVIRGLATCGQLILMSRAGNRIVAALQRRVYDHLLHQPVRFFSDRHSSELMARLAMAANGARDAVQFVINSAGRDVLTVVGLAGVMVYNDPLMSLIALSIAPVGVLMLSRLMKKVRRAARRSFDGSAEIMKHMGETAQGIRIIKSFNLEGVMRARMAGAISEVEKAANRMAVGIALSSPVSETLGGVAVSIIILYGGWKVAVAHSDPGSFFAFMGALLSAYEPAKRLGRLNLDLQNSLVGARLVYDLLDEPLPDARDATRPDLLPGPGRIALEGVSFSYRQGERVLDAIDLLAEPDRTTALVGPSGGGKSTIISLVQRLYEPESGQVLIDGQDVTTVNTRSLRDAIAFVAQDVFLFRGSVRDNIALGRPGADEAEIVDAARRAHAYDFIMGFDRGFDTEVGEQGAKLSGGQRQRIAIARAFLKKATIILLDEPTAALDSESEREVQKALDALRVGRTTIVVAHRLQTIVDADRICVIENGRAVEFGTHDELMARRGSYHSFFATQFGDRARRIA